VVRLGGGLGGGILGRRYDVRVDSYGEWCICLLASDACSLDSFLRVTSVHVCPFIPPEAIIHKTVAEANSVLRLWHNHRCDLFEQLAM